MAAGAQGTLEGALSDRSVRHGPRPESGGSAPRYGGCAWRRCARRASACSVSVICSKSLVRRTSSADDVKVASSSIVPGFSSRRLCVSTLIEHRFRQAAKARLLGAIVGRTRDLVKQQLHELFEHLRLLPEDMEGLVEQFLLVAPLHEDGMQRPIEIFARPQGARHGGIERIDHMARTDRQAGLAQHARKMHDVGRKLAARRGIVLVGGA